MPNESCPNCAKLTANLDAALNKQAEAWRLKYTALRDKLAAAQQAHLVCNTDREALEDRLKEAEAREKGLREALEDTGHSESCRWNSSRYQTPCGCGRAALAPEKETP